MLLRFCSEAFNIDAFVQKSIKKGITYFKHFSLIKHWKNIYQMFSLWKCIICLWNCPCLWASLHRKHNRVQPPPCLPPPFFSRPVQNSHHPSVREFHRYVNKMASTTSKRTKRSFGISLLAEVSLFFASSWETSASREFRNLVFNQSGGEVVSENKYIGVTCTCVSCFLFS